MDQKDLLSVNGYGNIVIFIMGSVHPAIFWNSMSSVLNYIVDHLIQKMTMPDIDFICEVKFYV